MSLHARNREETCLCIEDPRAGSGLHFRRGRRSLGILLEESIMLEPLGGKQPIPPAICTHHKSRGEALEGVRIGLGRNMLAYTHKAH